MHIYRTFEQYQNNFDTLIIVDVQKSFKKFFNDNYLKTLNQYCKQFKNVYQIWDNHVDGKKPDVDYLYDNDPDIESTKDLYKFPNQKDLIEKRYTYDVDLDFFKKILNKKTYRLAKINEANLKVGQYYHTTEGTIIVYVNNNHVWFHCPKKLYDLFTSKKGQIVYIVGGSDNECLLDIEIAAKALGVIIQRDNRLIWSGSNCPVK